MFVNPPTRLEWYAKNLYRAVKKCGVWPADAKRDNVLWDEKTKRWYARCCHGAEIILDDSINTFCLAS